MRWAYAVVILCVFGCSNHKYPPDELCTSGPWVYHRESSCGAITGPLACPEVDKVALAGLELANTQSQKDDLLSAYSALRVDIYGYPVSCGGYPAHGCQDGDTISLESVTAIPDELGHVIWETVYNRSGEHFENGKRVYDQDFAAWLDTVR